MRCLNEHLARKANEEDGCKGRFWEGRFKSQALLDDAALLTCMAYVDLNPVRAGLAKMPEDSDFTSLQLRIRQWQKSQKKAAPCQTSTLKSLWIQEQKKDTAIHFVLTDFLELVDWSGPAVRDDKHGAIEHSLPPILQRLGVDPEEWLKTLQPEGQHFTQAIGRDGALREFAEALGQKWVQGLSASQRLFVD